MIQCDMSFRELQVPRERHPYRDSIETYRFWPIISLKLQMPGAA